MLGNRAQYFAVALGFHWICLGYLSRTPGLDTSVGRDSPGRLDRVPGACVRDKEHLNAASV
ncbi:hypothetical protein PS850_05743 [Pseudomonas fluorescens]|nr:hypothetical protein PS850_05743 [Pseudomonas fluorescens]